jgi:Putative Actinobacterial Holin-X, holin superfamily III
MPTPTTESPASTPPPEGLSPAAPPPPPPTPDGVGPAAKQVAEHASALARLEMELAQLELKQKVTRLGIGAGLFVGAVILGLFAIGFALAAAAAAIATVLSTWIALLIVFGGLLLLAAVLALIGGGLMKKGSPPVPEQAIEEAKLATEAIKSNG